MSGYTRGDVSNSETLVGADHIYASHINELRLDAQGRIATKTVAPASSGYHADYYTPGTADDVNMNLAIAGGGLVAFRKGSYSLSNKLVVPSNTTLWFEPGSVVTIANGANVNAIENSDTTNGNVNITVDGLVLDGNKSNQSGAGWGIKFTKVTRPLVQNSYIHDTRNRCIHYSSCTDGQVKRCWGVSGGIFQEQCFTFELSTNCHYIDSYCSDGKDRDFEIAFCTNCQLHDCVSTSAQGAALGIYSTSTPNTGIVVDGLIALSPDAEVIYLERVQSSFFSNIYGYNVGTEGIRSYGDTSQTYDNTFENIYIYNPGSSGLLVNGKNTYTNCRIYSPGGYGFRFVEPGSQATNCYVEGAGFDCYWIGPSANYTGIVNCTGKNGGQSATATHTYGARIDAQYCTVGLNRFYDDQGSPTQTSAIREIAGGDWNTIIGNYVSSSGATIQYAGANTVVDNNPGF